MGYDLPSRAVSGHSHVFFAEPAFAGVIRSLLGTAEATVPGSEQLARGAFAGAIVGAASIAMAIVIVAAATSEGANVDAVVSRAVAGAATAGLYLVAAMGFAALLTDAGLLTLRSGVLPRWTGIVALIGAIAFLITFATLIVGTSKDSVFGYGFLHGILAGKPGRLTNNQLSGIRGQPHVFDGVSRGSSQCLPRVVEGTGAERQAVGRLDAAIDVEPCAAPPGPRSKVEEPTELQL